MIRLGLALVLCSLSGPALAAGPGSGLNLTAIGLFIAFVALTLWITWWAAKRTKTADGLLCSGRQHHGLPEWAGDCRRFHVGRGLPRHHRPRLRLRLRRANLRGRLHNRHADRGVPPRRAPAPARALHLHRRGLHPALRTSDPDLLGLRLAGRSGVLPHCADGRRRAAHPTPVRARLPLRRVRRRHPDDLLRDVWRHGRHHLGADRQGRAAARRRPP